MNNRAGTRISGDSVSAEWSALLDAAVDAIVVIDEAGCVDTFNAAAERMFGYSAAEIAGKPVDCLMPEPHRSAHAGYMRRYIETGEARIIGLGREVEALRADGTAFPIWLSVGEAIGAEGTRRFVAILRDLTEQRAAEQNMRKLESGLAYMSRFHLMGEMVAGIAHEINQPLSAIAAYAQAAKRMAQREPIDAHALRGICEKIDEQAYRAGEVMKNLRRFLRRREPDTERLDVNAVVAGIMDVIDADARSEGIEVVTDLGENVPEVRGDASQLQQVLLNLTRNAVDAMRDGPRKTRRIVIQTGHGPGETVRISVTDRGAGIPRYLADSIFEPFVTTKPDGLGIGLSISRTIVQALEGSLSHTNQPDGGATFAMDLPIAEPTAPTGVQDSGPRAFTRRGQ